MESSIGNEERVIHYLHDSTLKYQNETMSLRINDKALILLLQNKAKMKNKTKNSSGLYSYYYEVEGTKKEIHEVRIWEEYQEYETGARQLLHHSSCTCVRGSLINGKYKTICPHICLVECLVTLEPVWDRMKRALS